MCVSFLSPAWLSCYQSQQTLCVQSFLHPGTWSRHEFTPAAANIMLQVGRERQPRSAKESPHPYTTEKCECMKLKQQPLSWLLVGIQYLSRVCTLQHPGFNRGSLGSHLLLFWSLVATVVHAATRSFFLTFQSKKRKQCKSSKNNPCFSLFWMAFHWTRYR